MGRREGRREGGREGGREEEVMVAAANHLTSVVTTKGDKSDSLKETEGRIADALIKCKAGIHVFLSCISGIQKWRVKK